MIRLLFLVSFALLVASSYAVDVNVYFDSQAAMNAGSSNGSDRTIHQWTVEKDDTVTDGNYYVIFNLTTHIGGVTQVGGCTATVNVTNGNAAFAGVSGFNPLNGQYAYEWYRWGGMREGDSISYQFVRVEKQYVGPVNMPATLTGGPWNLHQVISPNASQDVVLPMRITLGNVCDPQPAPVTFNVFGSLSAEGTMRLELFVNGVSKGFKDVPGGPLDQAKDYTHTITIPGLPGEFGYEWRLGGTVLAANFAECGFPVPGAKFDDVVGQQTRDGPFVSEQPSEPDKPEVNPNPTMPELPPLNPDAPVTPPPPSPLPDGGSVTAPPPPTPPAPTPPTPTPEAAAPPPPNPYTPGGPGGGTTTPNMTKDDFYQAMRSGTKDGIKDMMSRLEGGGGEQPGDVHQDSNGNSVKFEIPPDDKYAKQLSDATLGMMDAFKTDARNMRQRSTEAWNSAKLAAERVKTPGLPTPSPGLGTTGLKISFRNVDYVVNLEPYRVAIDWLRKILVLIVTFTFWRFEIILIMKATQI